MDYCVQRRSRKKMESEEKIDSLWLKEPKERVRDLVMDASQVEMSEKVPIRRYYRSLNEMYRMAICYSSENNYEAALKLFTRFSSMWIECIPKHPESKTNTQNQEKAKARAVSVSSAIFLSNSAMSNHFQQSLQNLGKALDAAEKLKDLLRKQYEKEHEVALMRQAERVKAEEEREKQIAEDHAMALQLSAASRASSAAAASRNQSNQGLQPSTEEGLPPPYPLHSPAEMDNGPSDRSSFQATTGEGDVHYGFPPKSPTADPSDGPGGPPYIPDRSTKPTASSPPSYEQTMNTSPSPASAAAPVLPSVDRSLKPSTGLYGETSSNPHGLRDVLVPNALIAKFINIAADNSKNDIETCGILAAKLAGNQLIVSCLIIPKQTGTSDSCQMVNEEEVFEVQDARELITLGWVHTHPTQTAFLSSVDMHNHYSYQLMLPEAIAIVYSPKYQQTGIFMLSPDGGFQEIAGCNERGFHSHTQTPPLFQVCPHAKLVDGYEVSVVDLR